MSTEKNVQIVKNFLAALGRRDVRRKFPVTAPMFGGASSSLPAP